MTICELLLGDFEHEMANTKRVMARVEEERFDWQPHPKSWSMRGLATHLANLPTWAGSALNQDSLDIAPPGGMAPRQPVASVAELLSVFDQNVSDARDAIAGTNDAQLQESWTLLAGGRTVFTMSRLAVVRNFVIHHAIHHRAQLGVYLRLNDIPVPGVYGPSADES